MSRHVAAARTEPPVDDWKSERPVHETTSLFFFTGRGGKAPDNGDLTQFLNKKFREMFSQGKQ